MIEGMTMYGYATHWWRHDASRFDQENFLREVYSVWGIVPPDCNRMFPINMGSVMDLDLAFAPH